MAPFFPTNPDLQSSGIQVPWKNHRRSLVNMLHVQAAFLLYTVYVFVDLNCQGSDINKKSDISKKKNTEPQEYFDSMSS